MMFSFEDHDKAATQALLRNAYRSAIAAQDAGALTDAPAILKLKCLWVWAFLDFENPDMLSRVIVLIVGLREETARLYYPNMSAARDEAFANLLKSIEDCADQLGRMVDSDAEAWDSSQKAAAS